MNNYNDTDKCNVTCGAKERDLNGTINETRDALACTTDILDSIFNLLRGNVPVDCGSAKKDGPYGMMERAEENFMLAKRAAEKAGTILQMLNG